MLRDLLKQTTAAVTRQVFGEGDGAFSVDLKLATRPDLDRLGTQSTKRVIGRAGVTTETDVQKARAFLCDFVVAWGNPIEGDPRDLGLTVRKVLLLCNRSAESVPMATRDAALAFSAENVLLLLEEAVGFQEWVLLTVTRRADELADREAAEKKTSATTSGAT